MQPVDLAIFLTLASFVAARNNDAYCAGCRAMVDEIQYGISRVDPKKKIQVGSYRIDSNGNQKLQEIPYAQSEVYLSEQLEHICNGKVRDYALVRRRSDNHPVYVRTVARGDESPVFSNVQVDYDVKKSLQFACDELIDEHEDELMQLFKKPDPSLENRICIDMTGLCTPDQIAEYELGTVTEANQEQFVAKPKEDKAEAKDGDDDQDEDDDIDDEADKDENEENGAGDGPNRDEL